MTKAEWNNKYGFNDKDITYIYALSNSYDVKEQLKKDGFIYMKDLGWHRSSIPDGYEDKVVALPFCLVGEYMAWGEGIFKPETKEIVKKLTEPFRLEPVIHHGVYIGSPKERIRNYDCVLESVRKVRTAYGETQLVTFVDNFDNVFIWWTQVPIIAEIGSEVVIDFTIKEHKEYNRELQNVVNRVKIH